MAEISKMLNIPVSSEDEIGEDDMKLLDLNLDILIEECREKD